MSAKTLTDVHAHLAALPTPANGCRLSAVMRNHPLARFVAWRKGFPMDDPETTNRLYVEELARLVRESERVARAVVLAMDGVYGTDGRLDEKATSFLVTNAYAAEAVRGKPELLLGASVNPARRDALEELERAKALGAVLVKVLPNAMAFDPADPRFLPYYRALARLKLPLLSHIGYEFSLIGRDQSVGDPGRLRPALNEGVTVIAAHGMSTGLFFYEKHLKTFAELAGKYANLWADASALTLPNRFRMLLLLRRRPELAGRLVFGTDYPLPVFAFPALAAGPRACAAARRASNPFDRQAAVMEALGLPCRDFFSALR